MSNGVRTAVVVVCGLFIGGLGASGMPVQAHAQGWVAVAADSKGRWAMRSGSEPRREREPRPCGAAARPDAISRTQHGLAASPMWRAVRADIGMASAWVARRTRPSPRPGADAGWARRLERAES